MKFKFHAVIEWEEEIKDDDLVETYIDPNEGPSEDNLEEAKQEWLSDRKSAVTEDFSNIPEDAKISLEIDEVSK